MLTARAQKEDEEQGRKAGSDAYLTKAFSPLKLLDLVDNMLGTTS
jgi:DNA-binding response OmpR family regulator